MIKIASKSLSDLEFPAVCKQISEFCITQMGIEKALEITPYKTFKKSIFGLNQTNEYAKKTYSFLDSMPKKEKNVKIMFRRQRFRFA